MFYQHNCPGCVSSNIVKNGTTYYGKPRGKCNRCGRQFVFIRQHPPLSTDQKRRIKLLLAERISLDLDETKISQLPEEIGQLTNLQNLYLSGTPLSQLPQQIGQLKNLKTLDLTGTKILEDEINKIQAWLPNCKITY